MKKHLKIIFFLHLFISTMAFSQNKWRVDYTYNGKKWGIEGLPSTLYIDGNKSVYKEKWEKIAKKTKEGYLMTVHARNYKFLLDGKNKTTTLIECRTEQKCRTIDEKARIFDWKITEETKEILGYKVQKATAFFSAEHGDVIAWFAKDLPYSTGPEKIWGIPGLILELYYSKWGSFQYTAQKITKDEQIDLAKIMETSGAVAAKSNNKGKAQKMRKVFNE